MRIAIIGAGMAGLSCAQHLAAEGHEIVLYDKGRGPGGRLSGRRHDLGPIDHGAQYFTVRDPSFRSQVETWLAAGIVAPWTGRFVEDRAGGLVVARSERFIGTPRMNSCIRSLAEPFSVRWKTRIESIQRGVDDQWHLRDTDNRSYGPFDRVVIAIPPIQAADLLADYPDLLKRVQACSADPCWALMVWLPNGQNPSRSWDSWSSLAHPSLGWISWEQSKPGRSTNPRLLAHANVAWSTEHVDLEADQVIELLLPDIQQVIGVPLNAATDVQAHRWRYAKTAQALGEAALFDPVSGLGVCGDWCLEGRIEAAWVSGKDLAQRIGKAGL